MDSSNFAVAVSLTRPNASCKGYSFARSIFSAIAAARLLSFFAILEPLHVNTHTAGGACDSAQCSFHIGSRKVEFFSFGKFCSLSTCQRTDFGHVGIRRRGINAKSLFDQDRGRRCLHDKSKTLVSISRNNCRNRQTGLDILSLSIKGLAELHDI